jgi:hypothetical protein
MELSQRLRALRANPLCSAVRALRKRWHLPLHPFPGDTVNTAPEDDSIPGLFSTDESVVILHRFQWLITRSFHGLCSPSRSSGHSLSLACARPFPTFSKLFVVPCRFAFVVAIHDGAPRAHPSCGCSALFVGLRRFPLPRVVAGSRRCAFSAPSRGSTRAPLCPPPKRRRPMERVRRSLSVCPSREVRFPKCSCRVTRSEDLVSWLEPLGASHRPSWGL